MGLKNNLELLGRFISRGTFNQMFFFVSGPEMSVHLDGLIKLMEGWGLIGISLH